MASRQLQPDLKHGDAEPILAQETDNDQARKSDASARLATSSADNKVRISMDGGILEISDDSSELSSTHSEDFADIASPCDCDVKMSNNTVKIKKHQLLRDQEPVAKKSPKPNTELPARVYTERIELQTRPGRPNGNNLPSYIESVLPYETHRAGFDDKTLVVDQPVDPDTEPVRAKAASDIETTKRADAHLAEAAKYRDERSKGVSEWLDSHWSEWMTGRMRNDFTGWVELEADPDYFTVMLRRLKIERVRVVEVQDLDLMLSDHHCLKYGIIFLSRFHDEQLGPPEHEPSENLWFANQTVDNACATVAIMNIVNNVKTLELGENLKSFKNFTQSFNPIMKGEALANFNWCRRIHNAFAKRTEMLVANMAMQQEAEKSTKKKPPKSKSKSKVEDSETANHYIAYVPFEGELWKMDGMDMHARNLGPLEDGEAWINIVRNDIRKRMEVFADDTGVGYTILGIVEDKLPGLIDMLGRNINQLLFVEWCLQEKRDYWKKEIATNPEDNEWPVGGVPIRGSDFRYGLTIEILDKPGVKLSKTEMRELSHCSEEHLTLIRPDIVKEQLHLRSLIPPLREDYEKQYAKYKDRQFDYGPVIHTWLKFLDENGKLKPLLKWHKRNHQGNLDGAGDVYMEDVDDEADVADSDEDYDDLMQE